MPTLDLSKASSGFDMTDPNLVKGTGFTFNAAGRPTGGTATSIEIDVKNDSYPDLVITGISVAAATLDDGPASFWRLLEGNDVILGPESAQGAADGPFRFFGDGLAARDGGSGGRDIIRIGDGSASAVGDVWQVGSPTAAAAYIAGNDEILGLTTSTSTPTAMPGSSTAGAGSTAATTPSSSSPPPGTRTRPATRLRSGRSTASSRRSSAATTT